MLQRLTRANPIIQMTNNPTRGIIWLMCGASALLFASGWYVGSLILCLLAIALVSFTLAAAVSPLRGPLVSLGSVTLLLGFLESGAAVRGRLREAAPTSELHYDPSYRSRAMDLGRVANPGVHSAYHRSSDGHLIYQVTYFIGPDGFRVTPHSPADTSLRVNFFGCSFTFGEGVEDDQTFPAQVQSALPGSAAKNFGFHGYGVHQALTILTSERETGGDVNFLLTGPWHASRSACVEEWTHGNPRYRLAPDGALERFGTCNKQTLALRLFNRSALARALSLARLLDPAQDEQIELYLALAAEIARISNERGQKLIIGYMRAGNEWFNGSFDDDKVLARLAVLGVPIADLTLGSSAFVLPPEYRLHAEDPHPTPRAHRERALLAAQLIMRSTGTPAQPGGQ